MSTELEPKILLPNWLRTDGCDTEFRTDGLGYPESELLEHRVFLEEVSVGESPILNVCIDLVLSKEEEVPGVPDSIMYNHTLHSQQNETAENNPQDVSFAQHTLEGTVSEMIGLEALKLEAEVPVLEDDLKHAERVSEWSFYGGAVLCVSAIAIGTLGVKDKFGLDNEAGFAQIYPILAAVYGIRLVGVSMLERYVYVKPLKARITRKRKEQKAIETNKRSNERK